MKKTILNLEGAKIISSEQQKLLGGREAGESVNIRCPKKCCEWFEDEDGNPTSKCMIWSFCIGTHIFICP